VFLSLSPLTLALKSCKTHAYGDFMPDTLGGRLNSIHGRIHSIPARIHSIACRLHSIIRRLNSISRRIPSILAAYPLLISRLTSPYTLHPRFFSKSVDSISRKTSRVYSAPPNKLYSEDPGRPTQGGNGQPATGSHSQPQAAAAWLGLAWQMACDICTPFFFVLYTSREVASSLRDNK
jgi:hypothetical protein